MIPNAAILPAHPTFPHAVHILRTGGGLLARSVQHADSVRVEALAGPPPARRLAAKVTLDVVVKMPS